MTKENKQYKFTGRVIKCTYNSEDFKVYALDVDSIRFPQIQKTKYNSVTINGELPNLVEGVEYNIVAEEKESKYGIGYKVINITRDIPKSSEDMYLFLQEILTANQAKVLYEAYPDIVQRVKENRLDDIDLNKTKGIKEYTFNLIKEKIIENYCLSELVVHFQGYLSLSVIKKLYNKYTSIEVMKRKLSTNPYKSLCQISGVGFSTADSILLELEKISNNNIVNGKEPIIEFQNDLKTSADRCSACLLYLLSQNENEGHTKMSLVDLRTQCLKLTPACIEHFVNVIKNTDDFYYDKDTMEISLAKTFKLENEISEQISSVLHNDNKIWDFEIEKYRNVNEVQLSDEQMNAVSNVCKYDLSILNGAGGTGKSFCTQAIINMLKEHNKSFFLFSPTGKAAKVLSEYTKETATTIHRGLGYSPEPLYYYQGEISSRNLYDYYSNFTMNKYHKLKCDILIIDEFSMVDVWLFNKVLESIDFAQTKMLLIGDNAQLPSVSCGNLLHDFMSTGLIPTTTLTKVFRYGEGGLMKVATDVRFCKTYLDNNMKSKMTVFGDNKDYTFVDLSSDMIPKQAVNLYQKLLEKGYSIYDIQVLTAKNVGDCGTVVLNNMLQKVANPNYGKYTRMTYGEVTYYEGDLIIQKVNNYKAEIDTKYLAPDVREFFENQDTSPTAFIANGETGVIEEIFDTYMIIRFDNIYVKYYKSDLSMIGLGYSITIHKSQGSSIKIVILCTPQSHIYMANSNLLYVGLTRMKEKCYHLGCLDTVNKAVKKKENFIRHTWMQELLLNKEKESNNE